MTKRVMGLTYFAAVCLLSIILFYAPAASNAGPFMSDSLTATQNVAGHPEVDFFKKKFDVSGDIARQRLHLQGFAFPLSSALPKELGNEFSSLEFDNEAGEFIVRVRTDAGARLVPKVFEDEKVPASPRVEIVGFNQDELKARIAELGTQLESFISKQKAEVAAVSGHPEVWLSKSIDADQAHRIQRQIQGDLGTQIDFVDPDVLDVKPSACSGGDCDHIVGGVRFGSVATDFRMCSLGFTGTDGYGRAIVTTAGHCLLDTPRDRVFWNACKPGGSCTYAGQAFRSDFHFNALGDFGYMYVDEVASSWTALSRFADWSVGYSRVVSAAFISEPPVGITVCGNGMDYLGTTGGSGLTSVCGTVTANWASATGSTSGGNVTVNGLLRVDAHTGTGFSGAPWVFKYGDIYVATAIASSASGSGGSYAQPINRPVEWTGITIP